MRTVWRLAKQVAPHWRGVLAATGCGFLAVSANVGLMATSAVLISSAALQPPIADLMTLIVGVRFFGLSRGVFRYLERYTSHDVTFRILKDLRVGFYSALEPKSPACLSDYRGGDLLARIVADVETLRDFHLRVLAPTLTATLVLCAAFALLVRFQVGIALSLLAFFLLAGLVVPLGIGRMSRGLSKRAVQTRSELNAHLVDSIQGMADAVAYGQAGPLLAETARLGREREGLSRRAASYAGFSSAATSLAMGLALWSTLVLAIPLVHAGGLDGIYLAMLALGVWSCFEAVLPLPLVLPYLESCLAAARRLFQVADVDAPTGHPATTHPAQGDPGGGRGGGPECATGMAGTGNQPSYTIVVKDLRFAYGTDGPPVLDGLSFSLPEGGRLAISGPSGSGKSTLVGVLLRFWDYREGSIEVGGRQLRDFSTDEVNSTFAVVTQRTHLFNATIRENLLLADPSATESQMRKAAADAQMDGFIESLPQGYDTYLGEGGHKLSGGQRQRLAIARALLRDAPILLLDEATANLDPACEADLLQALEPLMRGRTVLIVSHRESALWKADQWLALKGR